MEKNVLFQSELISGEKYRRYRKTREIMVIIFVLIGFPVWAFGGELTRDVLSDDLGESAIAIYVYVAIVICAFVINFVLEKLSDRYEVLGSLEIDEENIYVNTENERKQYKLDALKSIEIIRRSSYHLDDDGGNFKGNNFIAYEDANGAKHKHEFVIYNAAHNEQFERMIARLAFNRKQNMRFLSV